MNTLTRLLAKKSKLIVGLMSGTSADGIDAALVRIRGNGTSTHVTQLAFITHPYPKGLKDEVLANSLPGSGSVDTICTLNAVLAHCFADAVKAVAKKARIPLSSIDAIGSHGQTVHHMPQERHLFGASVRSTLQLGSPSAIAKLTGIPTVGDFRTGDVALGGQGAPLVPYFDYVMFGNSGTNRGMLNIGGIANITLLSKKGKIDSVRAFDTGPGNMVIDALMKHYFGMEYDRNGEIAQCGRIVTPLLRSALQHPYFSQRLPKSTGREVFGTAFVKEVIRLGRGHSAEDLVATMTEFTALSVYDQYVRFGRKYCPISELIVSGGGAKNPALMSSLQRYFAPLPVYPIERMGFSSDAKEAVCFAVLANETLSGNCSNIPAVTGAKRGTVLGSINL